MAYCSSSSVGMRDLASCLRDEGVGTGGLPEQNVEGRNVVVPFDEGRNRTEARERLAIKRPHILADARRVVVDAQDAAVWKRPDGVTRKMDLPDDRRRQRGKIRRRVPTVVAGADIDVVDVAQDAAAGAAGDRGDELPFRDGRMAKGQVG